MNKQNLSVRQLTLMAVTMALLIIISYIPAFRIGEFVAIGIGFIGTAISAILFGPLYGAIIAMAADLITFFLNGVGTFFPGFTITAGVAASIYGFFLYKRIPSWTNVFFAVLSVTIIANLGLNSIWVKLLTDRAWSAFMLIRIIKNIISLPVNTILLKLLLSLPVVEQFIKKYQC